MKQISPKTDSSEKDLPLKKILAQTTGQRKKSCDLKIPKNKLILTSCNCDDLKLHGWGSSI